MNYQNIQTLRTYFEEMTFFQCVCNVKLEALSKCESILSHNVKLCGIISVTSVLIVVIYFQKYSLPTIPGRHKDMKSVSPNTVSQLLEGMYDDVISGYQIIDCRYPYEYEGGHIEVRNSFIRNNPDIGLYLLFFLK